VHVAAALLLLLSPETERMLLGPSPFFRREGIERALRLGETELIVRAARSRHWDARRVAAAAMGPEAPLELLKDPVAVVREAAARALDTHAPPEALIPLLKDPDDAVRAAAAWALRGRREKRHVKPLLQDESPGVRLVALAALGRNGDLIAMSKRDSLAEAVPALALLGEVGGPAEAANLISRLAKAVKYADKQRDLLYYWDVPRSDIALARAVGDLARRGVSPGGKSVAALLRKIIDKNSLARSGGILLAEAVAGARDAEAARRIVEAQIRARKTSTLVNSYFDPALRGVLHAFSRSEWVGLAPLLYPLLDARDATVRLAMIKALHGDAALPGLRDPDPRVRVAALRRVRRLKSLVEMAGDTSPAVQRACAWALGRTGDPQAAPTLRRLLESPHADVRRTAVGALLRVPEKDRIDLLVKVALRDGEASVRRAAAAVLAFLDDPSILPRAISALADHELVMRRNAIALVHALTSARIAYEPKDPEPGAKNWGNWWEQRRERANAPDRFRYHVQDLRRKGLDLVLVLDATASMAPVVQATKRRLVVVMNRLRDIVPNLRVRIVAYRDKGDAFLTVASPLTHSARVLEDYLACIPADGGGDPEEAVLAGLRRAMSTTPWRDGAHRVVILFGDAPPHERHRTLLETSLKEFKGTVHTVHASRVFGRGVPSSVAKSFAEIAQWGGGRFVHLKDEDDLLRNILVLALGASHKSAIETLFGL
jgi:HEAT repeat protein